MTGCMIGDFMSIDRTHIGNLEDIDQVFREFKNTTSYVDRETMFPCSLFKQRRIMVLDHAHTGTRRRHSRRVRAGKGVYEVLRNGTSLFFETVVIERLSAACLIWRENDFNAKPLQNPRHVL